MAFVQLEDSPSRRITKKAQKYAASISLLSQIVPANANPFRCMQILLESPRAIRTRGVMAHLQRRPRASAHRAERTG